MKNFIAASCAALVLLAGMVAAETPGSKIYGGKCAKCHGVDGDGSGKAGRMLDPKPTDFTSSKWQTDRKDDAIVDVIANGNKSSKLKISRKMPEFGSKLSKDQVQSLVTVIRGFKKAKAK